MRPNALFAFAVAAAVAVPRLALPHARQSEAPDRWGPYAVEIVDERGAQLPTFQHRGQAYVLGELGARYLVRVRNGSGQRAEVVVSVDGRDVVDGRPSALGKRGYIVAAYGEVTIDGFRLDERSVAAFRFSSVSRSYASRMGDARDVGVIGVAVFPERPRPMIAPPAWSPERAPYDDALPQGSSGAEPRSEAPRAKSAQPALRDASPPTAERYERPGLGTEFGEEHGSSVERVAFERAAARPAVVLTVRYDDREGLLAAGIDVDGRRWAGEDAWMRRSAEPFRRDPVFAEPPPGWAGR